MRRQKYRPTYEDPVKLQGGHPQKTFTASGNFGLSFQAPSVYKCPLTTSGLPRLPLCEGALCISLFVFTARAMLALQALY